LIPVDRSDDAAHANCPAGIAATRAVLVKASRRLNPRRCPADGSFARLFASIDRSLSSDDWASSRVLPDVEPSGRGLDCAGSFYRLQLRALMPWRATSSQLCPSHEAPRRPERPVATQPPAPERHRWP